MGVAVGSVRSCLSIIPPLESLAFDLKAVWRGSNCELLVLELLEFGWPIFPSFMHVLSFTHPLQLARPR